ncbi:hypothetical protein [Ureibacillus aquaedulcis]|uniref:Tissue inhibitor of metalloproteinase n=1 Tax=Ureibacillus aquaedulcis TaxID=3058421 RepID=A0ABT8GS46_9BACL|nr:hypothetical protein [Ureibacillus sp. BA0131]MDN4493781.1 hypothetical protein [Ureibacillus sp. BA0131]
MRIKLLLVFLFIFPFLVNFSSTSSLACSCIEPGGAVEEMDNSDFVFTGKVTAIHDPNKNAFIKSSADLLEIKFEVSDTWKGVEASEVLIYTERDSASCGFKFTLDGEYLVYGNEHDGKKSVNLCSNTALLVEVADDLAALGKGQKPSEVVELAEGQQNSMDILITIFAGVALLIIVASAMFVKKFNRR